MSKLKFFNLSKISFVLFFTLGIAPMTFGQNNFSKKVDSASFFQMQGDFMERLKEKQNLSSPGEEEDEDGPDELFQRWSYWMIPRMYPKGIAPAPDAVSNAWHAYIGSHGGATPLQKTNTWYSAGPKAPPSSGGGTGRVNIVLNKPGSPNVIWIGTPDGGLWKSTDTGASWLPLTDTIPNLGVADLALDPKNSDILYMATGDGYGYSIPSGWFSGGTYSNGIMKSTDGGNTFYPTGLNYSRTQTKQIFRVAVNPGNSKLVYAATDNGLFLSKDAGATWNKLVNDYFVDIKFNPTNPAIGYASGTAFYYSTDSGKTWSINNSTFANNGFTVILLGVTPADSNIIYALGVTYSSGYLYKSSNQGLSWSYVKQTSPSYYGKYAACITVSPTDANHIVLGGVGLAESTDGGSTFYDITVTNNYNDPMYDHPDHRSINFKAGSNDTLFDGNDGGSYMGVRQGTGRYIWKMISKNIQTLQFYGVSTAYSSPSEFFSGAQDNGINRSNNGGWDHVLGADGMLCAVKPDNARAVYANNQYGYLSKSTDGGNTWTGGIGPSLAQTNNWIAPISIDPNSSKTLYYGGDDLYKSTNNGSTWKSMNANNSDRINVALIAVAPSTSNYIYVVKRSDYSLNYAYVYLSTDGGNTWNNIGGDGLPTGYVYVSDIKVDRKDSQKVWLTIGGFNDGQKVYMSKDAGAHWKNISGTLPNIPINCVAVENSTQGGVYIGTEVGVFYRTDSSGDWTRYSDGLPNTIITQIEVLPSINILRASTFGRGIWEGSIAGTILGIDKMQDIEDNIKIYPNPSNGIFNISFPTWKTYAPRITIYDLMGRTVYESIKTNNASGEIVFNLPGLKDGIYTIALKYNDVVAYKKILINHE